MFFVVTLSCADYIIPWSFVRFMEWLSPPARWLYFAVQTALLRRFLHRGKQYTSGLYRDILSKYGIIQSMNSAGGRCHDNARCESMWARMKEELFYSRGGSEIYSVEELKHIIWVYYMSY